MISIIATHIINRKFSITSIENKFAPPPATYTMSLFGLYIPVFVSELKVREGALTEPTPTLTAPQVIESSAEANVKPESLDIEDVPSQNAILPDEPVPVTVPVPAPISDNTCAAVLEANLVPSITTKLPADPAETVASIVFVDIPVDVVFRL